MGISQSTSAPRSLSSPQLQRLLRHCAGPALIVLASAAMACWTWGTWPDIVIDFGRELYVPWQLSEGKALYRDIAHIYGPLSHYFNALLFVCFGVSLQTLVMANMVLLACLIGLIYWLLSVIASRFAATAACLTVVLLFAFGQYVPGIGNFNYITPYSHEMTHGIILAFAAIALFATYLRHRGRAALFLSGLALGLCFLTKPEPFLAGDIAVAGGLLLASMGVGRREALIRLFCFVAGQAVPPVTALALLLQQMRPNEALHAVMGSWPYVLGPRVTSLAYHRQRMGLVDWQSNCVAMLVWATLYLMIFGVGAFLACRIRQRRVEEAVIVSVAFLATLGSVAWCLPRMPWANGWRPLPLVLAAVVLAFLYRLYRHRGSAEVRAVTVLQVTLSLFGLLMMLREILCARICDYGFALTMPATLVAVCLLTDWIPKGVKRSGGSPATFIALVAAVWIAAVYAHLRLVDACISPKTVPIGQGRDAFLSDGRATAIAVAVREIEARLLPSQTITVFPEGIMLNYLSRRRNPTQYLWLLPDDTTGFGEGDVLSSLASSPPDAVVLLHRTTYEYGFPLFGRDYGMRTAAWIHANYRPTWRIGAIPLVDPRQFGILLLLRKPDTREAPEADNATPVRPTGHYPPYGSP